MVSSILLLAGLLAAILGSVPRGRKNRGRDARSSGPLQCSPTQDAGSSYPAKAWSQGRTWYSRCRLAPAGLVRESFHDGSLLQFRLREDVLVHTFRRCHTLDIQREIEVAAQAIPGNVSALRPNNHRCEVSAVEEDIVTGRPATAEEDAIVAIALEGVKQATSRLSESLSRLVTLSTAMTGGALAALKDDVCTGWGRVGAAAFFFLALAAAVAGSLPRLSRAEWDLDSMAAEVRTVIHRKEWIARICCLLLALGSLVALIGSAVRAGG